MKRIPKQCLNCGNLLDYNSVKDQIKDVDGNIIAGTCPKCGATYDRRSIFRQHSRRPRKRCTCQGVGFLQHHENCPLWEPAL